MTAERKTIYIGAPPSLEREMRHMDGWGTPSMAKNGQSTPRPKTEEIVDYMSAFYHGMPVKPLSARHASLSFADWGDSDGGSRERTVALKTGTEMTRIRSRPCPDKAFPYQLNLNDILDVVIAILPSDAYCLLLLVEQDLYEDEEDDYCCGRAYGGSRCAVVSMARYNPFLIHRELSSWDRAHAWPASHCQEYVKEREQAHRPRASARKGVRASQAAPPGEIIDLTSSPASTPEQASDTVEEEIPLEAAIRASRSSGTATGNGPTSTWLSSVCRTASHEIGHCLGMDHCVYYACVMQGSASGAEDQRQPPYLCPVELAKVRQAICGEVDEKQQQQWMAERYHALLRVCDVRTGQGEGGMWAGYAAWLKARLMQVCN